MTGRGCDGEIPPQNWNAPKAPPSNRFCLVFAGVYPSFPHSYPFKSMDIYGHLWLPVDTRRLSKTLLSGGLLNASQMARDAFKNPLKRPPDGSRCFEKTSKAFPKRSQPPTPPRTPRGPSRGPLQNGDFGDPFWLGISTLETVLSITAGSLRVVSI